MLYKDKDKQFNMQLFKNPTKEYRATPFWSWNCKPDKGILSRQLKYFKQMGFGGAHIHSRTGMGFNYLGKDFMEMVKFCVNEAKESDMLIWLYDEDRWPSGFAGGLVTKEGKFRVRRIILSETACEDVLSMEEALENGGKYFVASYSISLNQNGELTSYKNTTGTKEESNIYVYSVTEDPTAWYNNGTYSDNLNPECVEKFISITHEKFKETVGEEFGKTIPSIFTDEPRISLKKSISSTMSVKEFSFPWTYKVTEGFLKEYGFDILDYLPEIIWDLPDGKVSKARYCFNNYLADLFANSYAKTIGKWCKENNIAFTGHMLAEKTLENQSRYSGDLMRIYPYFEIPGMDLLLNQIQFTTAKQVQSIKRQYNREAMLSELYGVTNWDFNFAGHKFQGDWQAALGVTVRVPHLSWVSMEGEAKRDFPASISYQSPWYKEYGYVENHFARLNTVLTRGKDNVRVGMITPLETTWLYRGCSDEAQYHDMKFDDITKWLLLNCIDFDYISEAIIPTQYKYENGKFVMGNMSYDVVIVPNCVTIRKTTVDALVEFAKNGGKVILTGSLPKYIEAEENSDVSKLCEYAQIVDFDKMSLLKALDNYRDVRIVTDKGAANENYIYQMREEKDNKWLFIARAVKPLDKHNLHPDNVIISIKGEYTPVVFDTIAGDIKDIPYTVENGITKIRHTLYSHDSLLLKLESYNGKTITFEEKAKPVKSVVAFKDKVRFTTEEPNVLLLDFAEYCVDGGEWNDGEEILKLDDAVRAKVGYPNRNTATPQPWVSGEKPCEHTLKLRYRINSQEIFSDIVLAVENPADMKIELNGNEIEKNITGYYVDESIKTLKLGTIQQGENILTVEMPFGQKTNPEAMFLLGNFGVKVEGCKAQMTTPINEVAFGSITTQGFPYYGGNMIYETQFTAPGGKADIRINSFEGAACRVKVDGKDCGIIAYDPYTVTAELENDGAHTLKVTVYGNRHNTFGALHNCAQSGRASFWAGPAFWRTTDDLWCYEYMLKDTGILMSPVIKVYEK